jgi:hypothetical protein
MPALLRLMLTIVNPVLVYFFHLSIYHWDLLCTRRQKLGIASRWNESLFYCCLVVSARFEQREDMDVSASIRPC